MMKRGLLAALILSSCSILSVVGPVTQKAEDSSNGEFFDTERNMWIPCLMCDKLNRRVAQECTANRDRKCGACKDKYEDNGPINYPCQLIKEQIDAPQTTAALDTSTQSDKDDEWSVAETVVIVVGIYATIGIVITMTFLLVYWKRNSYNEPRGTPLLYRQPETPPSSASETPPETRPSPAAGPLPSHPPAFGSQLRHSEPQPTSVADNTSTIYANNSRSMCLPLYEHVTAQPDSANNSTPNGRLKDTSASQMETMTKTYMV